MKILAIDTSGKALNAGVLDSKTGVFFQHQHLKNEARAHSSLLLPAVISLLKQISWSFEDLDRVVLTQGPGSFTGLRIGATAAKIITDQTNSELIPVSTLSAISKSHDHKIDKRFLRSPLINARNHNVFSSLFDQNGSVLIKEAHFPFSDFISLIKKPTCFIFEAGTGDEFKEEIKAHGHSFMEFSTAELIDSRVLAEMALVNKPVSSVLFHPNYLRKTAAEMNWLKKHPDQIGKSSNDYVSEV